MGHSKAFLDQLKHLNQAVGKLLNIDDNIFDTSGFDRATVDKLKQLQGVLGNAMNNATASAGNSISASVGNNGTNKAEDVRVVQTLLKSKGHNLTVDGQIGRQTIGAIEAFQKSIFNGWSDGTIEPGKNTWKALSEGSSTTTPTDSGSETPTNNTPTDGISASVGRGGTNNEADVTHIQELLNKVGAQVTVDGKIGNNTITAIENVQLRLGMNTPDGLIEPGKNTYKALAAGNIPEPAKPSGNYFSHPRANTVRISYGSNAVHLNANAEHLLRSVLAASGNRSAKVTSSYRSYYHQARVMIDYYTVAQMERLYARGAEFGRLRRQARENINEFARLLEQADKRTGRLVSLHVTGFAIDVVPGQNRSTYARKMQELVSVSGSGVSRFLPLGTAGEKVDHVEFTFRVV